MGILGLLTEIFERDVLGPEQRTPGDRTPHDTIAAIDGLLAVLLFLSVSALVVQTNRCATLFLALTTLLCSSSAQRIRLSAAAYSRLYSLVGSYIRYGLVLLLASELLVFVSFLRSIHIQVATRMAARSRASRVKEEPSPISQTALTQISSGIQNTNEQRPTHKRELSDAPQPDRTRLFRSPTHDPPALMSIHGFQHHPLFDQQFAIYANFEFEEPANLHNMSWDTVTAQQLRGDVRNRISPLFVDLAKSTVACSVMR